MQSKVSKDKKLRKFIYYEGLVLKENRNIVNKRGIFLAPNFFYSRIKNFCVFSQRSRFVFKKLHISRLIVQKSIFSGVGSSFFQKCSW